MTVGEAKRRLHSISDDTLKLLRNEEVLADGVRRYEEFEREVDEIGISDKGMLYNLALLDVLQIKNLLTCSRVAAKMALARKESRGLHLREDYPFIDNENWQVRQTAKLKNGAG